MARKGYASVTITEAVNELVMALAGKMDRSKSWVIEEAVKLYIKEHEGKIFVHKEATIIKTSEVKASEV